MGAGSIPRADVAALAVEALTNPGAAGAKFSIYCRKPGEPLAGSYDEHIKAAFAK